MKNNPSSSKTVTGIGRSKSPKLHLKKVMLGEGWTHMDPKDPGPDVDKNYEMPQREDPSLDEPCHRKSDEDTTFLCEEQQQQEGAGQSLLTKELLPLGENVTDVLDYDEDPEVIAAIANIPPMDDVKMQDVNPPLGFDPEVGRTGYNHNLVLPSGEEALGPVPW